MRRTVTTSMQIERSVTDVSKNVIKMKTKRAGIEAVSKHSTHSRCHRTRPNRMQRRQGALLKNEIKNEKKSPVGSESNKQTKKVCCRPIDDLISGRRQRRVGAPASREKPSKRTVLAACLRVCRLSQTRCCVQAELDFPIANEKHGQRESSGKASQSKSTFTFIYS